MPEPVHIPLAKITPPRIGVPLLARDQLDQLVRTGIQRKLLILSAEAGYGKTSLLISTLPGIDLPSAWVTLDHTDGDANLFGAAVAAGVARVSPEAAVFVERLLALGPNPTDVRKLLIRMLEEAPPLVIVLDDFHAIDDRPQIIDLVDDVLTHLPPTAHVVVATRTWPKLATLPRLLVQGEAAVVDKTRLRFSETETASFLRELHELSVDDVQAAELARRTEGWPAALQLLALASKARGQPALSGTPREVFEYLASTVLASLDEAAQEFLLRTSILTELWPSLCEAVAPQIPAVEMLRDLERRNLFLLRLDDLGPRYRYHQLFAEFLQDRLRHSTFDPAALHQAAAQRLEAEQIPDRAVRHYFAAGEYGEAERVMKPLHGDRLTAQLAYTFRELVMRLPDEIQAKYPWMTRCGASAARFVGDYDLGLLLARRALSAAEGRDVDLWTFSIHGVGIMLYHLDRLEESAALCAQALQSLDPGVDPRFRGGVISDLLTANLRLGRIPDAAQLLPMLEQIVLAGTQPGQSYGLPYFTGDLAAARMEYGRALEQYTKTVQVAIARGSSNAQLWALLGVLRAEIGRRNLAAARQALAQARVLHEFAGERYSDLTLMHLTGDVHLLAGEWPEAESAYAQTISAVRETESQEQRLWAQVGLARLARARGHLRESEALLSSAADRASRLKLGSLLPQVSFEQVAVLRLEGKFQDAREVLAQVRETMHQWDSQPGLARCDLYEAQIFQDVSSARSLGPEASDRLRRVLVLDPAVIGEAVPFLKAEASWAVPLIIAALREGVEPNRAAAVLTAVGDDAVEHLIPLVGDTELGGQAIAILGAIGDPRARRPLVTAARQIPALRQVAQEALSRLREPEPVSLQIRTLGTFEIYRGSELIRDSAWKTQKVKTLLKFLLLHRGRRVPQDEIIEVLWPDVDPAARTANLKGAIKTLRQALEPLVEGTHSSFVLRAGETIQFVTGERCRIDLDDYDRLLNVAQAHEAAGRFADAVTALEQAAALYRGDLCEEDRYEDWPAAERERRREMQIMVLETLADLHGRRRDYRRAVEAIQRVLALDRLREPAYRHLMRFAMSKGDHQAAVRAYETCERLLREELGVPPHPETISLYERARTLTPA